MSSISEFLKDPKYLHISGRGKGNDFRELLLRDAGTISVLPITAAVKALMDRRGKLNGAYVFTRPALFQICQLMGSGLYAYIDAMCAKSGTVGYSDEQIIEYVAQTYNQAVKFNFAGLKDTRFVVTRGANTVDGHIGRSFVMVYNSRVYDAATEIASGMAGGMDFVDGIISGRDLNATFCCKTPLATIGGISVYRGLVVQNRETGGRAIRLSNTIFDTKTRSYSMDVFHRDTRIVHVAPSKVITKMMELSDTIVHRQQKSDAITAAFNHAMVTKVSPKWNPDISQKFKKALQVNMLKHEVPAYAIDHVVKGIDVDKLQSPTRMDVYGAAVKSATSFSEGISTRLRQYAYLYLFQKN